MMFLIMALGASTACKTNVERKALRPVNLNTPGDRLSEKDELLNRSLEDLQKSIDKYKESEDYIQPQSESEKDFNSMVDAVDQLDKESTEFLAEKGEFSHADERSGDIEERTSFDEDGGDEQARAIKKSGILMISLGTLGTMVHLAGGTALEIGYRRMKQPDNAAKLPDDVQKQVEDVEKVGKQLGTPELDYWVNRARIANLALAGIPIAFVVMGSLLVSQEKPSDAIINTSQVLLYAAGGLGAATGATLVAVASNPTWSRKAADAISTGLTKAAGNAAAPSGGVKSAGFPGRQAIGDDALLQIRKFSLGPGLILAALGGTLLFSGSSLNLAETEDSPKVKLLKSIDVFTKRMRQFEASLKL